MSELRLFAVTETGPQRLRVPAQAADFTDLYADLSLGVYSALRTFEHNKFLALDDHLQRTRLSMAALGRRPQFDEVLFRIALDQVATSFPAADARVRFDFLVEPAIALGTNSDILIALQPFAPVPAECYTEGVSIDYAPELTREHPRAKTAEFALRRRQFTLAHKNAVYDHLIMSSAGKLLEGAMTNFWAARAGAIWTADNDVLQGITRKILFSLISDLGIPLHLRAISKDDVADLDEAAISGSSRAIVPVVRIGQQVIGSGRPGPIFSGLLDAYRSYVAASIRTAVE